MSNATLPELRGRLDQIDDDIIRHLAKRLETVGLIAEAKAGKVSAIRDPKREREILARVESLASSLGVSGPLARRIFSEIIGYSVSRQVGVFTGQGVRGEIRVGYQGQPLTYNHLAAEAYIASLGGKGQFVGVATLAVVVEQVISGQLDLAFLPIENTVAGSINLVYDLLREQDLHIVGEDFYKVELCLSSVADVPLSALRRIYSHPLALEQCSAFLAGLPQAQAIPCPDSREAMRLVAEAKDPTFAAIGSPEACQTYELFPLRQTIGNEDEILMRYVALSTTSAQVDPRVPCKTSLILSTRHEKGALLSCLQSLGEHGVSLTKLESRPRPNRPWEYMFFIDFEGNVADARVSTALEALRSQALYLKILGCYPAKATPVVAAMSDVPPSSPMDAKTPPATATVEQSKPAPVSTSPGSAKMIGDLTQVKV